MSALTDVVSSNWRGIDPSFAERFSEEYAAAWNSHQPERVLACVTNDVVWVDAAWPGGEIRGHAGVRAYLDATWRAIPDMQVTLEKSALLDPAGPRAARYWHATATHTGKWDPPGLLATGRRISWHGGTFLEFRDGKACGVRVVYDVAELMRQLGVLPKGGSRGERLAFWAANLRTRLRRR